MEWLLSRMALLGSSGDGDPQIQIPALSPPNNSTGNKKSISNSANTGSSSGSTPVASPVKVGSTALLTMCFKDDCARDCASDAAASLAAEDSQWQTAMDDGGTPQHYRGAPRRKRSVGVQEQQDSNGKHQKQRSAKSLKHGPPQSISIYRPTRSWPDGTLQILWQKKKQSAFGIKGVDMYEAHLELTLDDLSTIEISSEIASKYSTGTVEVHPDETTIQRIGSITCYSIRPMALQLPAEIDKDCPQQLQELVRLIPQNTMFKSWRKNEVANLSKDDFEDSIQDLHWRHHWHQTATILSYLWIEDVSVDSRYRGVGLGLCLIEDACKRVAEVLSWIIAAPKRNTSLEDYFSLMGFAPLLPKNASLDKPEGKKSKESKSSQTTSTVDDIPSFLARWNASPLNPKLDEVLPCVPHTAQQSKDQGFHL